MADGSVVSSVGWMVALMVDSSADPMAALTVETTADRKVVSASSMVEKRVEPTGASLAAASDRNLGGLSAGWSVAP